MKLLNPFFIFFFHIYIIMSKTLSAKYFQENKERLQKKLVKDIKIFLKKKKKKWSRTSQNLSEDEKQKLVESKKKYYRTRKNSLL